ncbi:MAG: phosphatidate cytidylyltransferase [Phycisphaerales bacterium]|nr:phosphatidate cytidylyltransferase [Phycisphaerales bacterium]
MPTLASTTLPPMFGFDGSLDDPGVRLLLMVISGLLAAAVLIVGALAASGRVGPEMRSELTKRTLAWAVMAPLVGLPILLGKLPTVLMVTIIGLLCYREFARATGLFRDKTMSALVAVGIVLFNFAALDHWFGLWQALSPLSLIVIAACAILRDQPKGYIQRVGLGVFSVLLFGACLSHLSYFANEPTYRAPLLLLIIAMGMNDVFAFCTGKLIGGPKLRPNTSPGKTISGALGAIALTTTLAVVLGSRVFSGELAALPHLIVMGMLVSIAGILGDLTVSSVKRDVGIKDMGNVIPGHGGVLDRVNSLLLAAPAIFHYVMYFRGLGEGQPTRIFSRLFLG